MRQALTKRQLLLIAVESPYGLDAAPQETDLYQQMRLLEPFRLTLGEDFEELGGTGSARGFSEGRVTGWTAEVTFRALIGGVKGNSYTAAVKPHLSAPLRACGCAERYGSAGNGSYTYSPTIDPSSDESATIVAHQDGFDYRMVGCRGNANLTFVAGAPPVAEFSFRGILTTEATTTRSAPVRRDPPNYGARLYGAGLYGGNFFTVRPPRWVGSGSVHVGSVEAFRIDNLSFGTANEIFEQRSALPTSGSGVVKYWVTGRAPGGSFDAALRKSGILYGSGVYGAGAYVGNDQAILLSRWRTGSDSVLRVVARERAGNSITLTTSRAVFKTLDGKDRGGAHVFGIGFQAYRRGEADQFSVVFD